MVCNLGEKNSIANQFLLELRDQQIQQDPMRFRYNMQRLGYIMAYEISRVLEYKHQTIQTPLDKVTVESIKEQPVLITVMRAGVPYFQGFVDMFDKAECGFIGAYRKEGTDEVTINLDYLATPPLADRTLILVDPMLATGKSFVKAVHELMRHGKPKHIHVAALVAAPEGIQFIRNNMPVPFTIWTFAVDEKLNDHAYIVPGLGDAGDLSYGRKV